MARELNNIIEELKDLNSYLKNIDNFTSIISNLITSDSLVINTDNDYFTGYTISGTDTVASTEYYGYLKNTGEWYIKSVDKSVANIEITKFITGDNDYSTNWTNRASLTYNYIDNI